MNVSVIGADEIPVPRILSIGFSDEPAVTRFGPSRRKQYIIHYVLSGRGVFNGSEVSSGQGFLITPGMDEEYFPDASEPWSFLWIISEDESMANYFERHGADKMTGIFEFHNKYVLESVINALGQGGARPASSAVLAELFLRIFNESVVSSTATNDAARRYVDLSEGFVTANLHHPITVSALCKFLGVSQPYLYKVFRETLGASPKEYISARKITEAKRLLRESSLYISEVASAVGFYDALAFSRFFSKNVGMSPTAFRRSNK